MTILFVSILCAIYYRVHINEFSANLSCLSHLFYKCLLERLAGPGAEDIIHDKSYSLPCSLEEADVIKNESYLVINIKPHL